MPSRLKSDYDHLGNPSWVSPKYLWQDVQLGDAIDAGVTLQIPFPRLVTHPTVLHPVALREGSCLTK